MGLHVSNLSLVSAIADGVREIGKELFNGPAPQFLHHYTSARTVEAIIQSRSLWATCIDDQRDKTEISHASALVTELVGEISTWEKHAFALEVLSRLPFYMEERKQWIYIACFCGDHDSALHWRDYGGYRLTFSAPWSGLPSLAFSCTQAYFCYQPVIYDEYLQRNALERALRSIVLAISKNTGGQNEIPWPQIMVDMCAMNAAQLLLSLAVGFKRARWEDEKEWRIVCAPRLGSNSAAPQSIDEIFSVYVNRSPRRHVALQLPREHALFQPLLVPQVPFQCWASNPRCHNARELDSINSVLKSNCRSDLCLDRHYV